MYRTGKWSSSTQYSSLWKSVPWDGAYSPSQRKAFSICAWFTEHGNWESEGTHLPCNRNLPALAPRRAPIRLGKQSSLLGLPSSGWLSCCPTGSASPRRGPSLGQTRLPADQPRACPPRLPANQEGELTAGPRTATLPVGARVGFAALRSQLRSIPLVLRHLRCSKTPSARNTPPLR